MSGVNIQHASTKDACPRKCYFTYLYQICTSLTVLNDKSNQLMKILRGLAQPYGKNTVQSFKPLKSFSYNMHNCPTEVSLKLLLHV